MPKKLIVRNLYISTTDGKLCLHTTFSESINMIFGRNTSGKSSLLLSILYSFGINDVKQKLKELISLDIVFRVDFSIDNAGLQQDFTFIRDEEFLVIKMGDGKVLRLNGIGADNSKEHIKLKEFWQEALDCSLVLESNSGTSSAPIEAMFLPYYISQDVGWVYLRKSFSNLDFYKSFKETFLDYYFGVESFVDRTKRREIEQEMQALNSKLEALSTIDSTDVKIVQARLGDAKNPEIAKKYLDECTGTNSEVITLEKQLLLKCNEQSYFTERRSILSKVSKNHGAQHSTDAKCPVCLQLLPYSTAADYKFQQEANDTEREIEHCKTKMRELQSDINSLRSKITRFKEELGFKNQVFETRKESRNVSEWIDEKACLAMDRKISEKVGTLSIRLNSLKGDLKNYSEEDSVQLNRIERSKRFKEIYTRCLSDIGIVRDMEHRFYDPYLISAFPAQGVELHKMITAYYFSFNLLIKECETAHRLPLILDAIFKEDLEDVNKQIIMNFVSKWKPTDTQMIFTVSDSPKNALTSDIFNRDNFNGSCKMIRIGDGDSERCLLSDANGEHNRLFEETMALFEQN